MNVFRVNVLKRVPLERRQELINKLTHDLGKIERKNNPALYDQLYSKRYHLIKIMNKNPISKLKKVKNKKYFYFSFSHSERKFVQFMRSTYEEELLKLENDDILTGLLLSDASLMKIKSKRQTSYFSITLTENNKDLIYNLSDYLNSKQIFSKVSISYNTKYKPEIRLTTKAYQFFGMLRKKWYPHGVKMVPRDIVLTPKSLAYWFMGDGSSNWKKPYNRVDVRFFTNAFSSSDVEFLKNQLLKFDISPTINYIKTGPVIRFSSVPDVTKFMNLIEPFIFNSFKYKIKKPEYTESGRKRMNTMMTQNMVMM